MLEQLVELFLLMPDVEVWVSVDSRLKQFGQQLKERTGVDGNQPFVLYADAQTPWAVFEECCRGADWTLIVAPELGGLLEDACGRCVVSGGRLLGSGLKLRQLGIDKQRLHLWADNHDIPMPPGESRRPGPRILIGPLLRRLLNLFKEQVASAFEL